MGLPRMQVAGWGPYPQGQLGLQTPAGPATLRLKGLVAKTTHSLGPAKQGLRGWCLAPSPRLAGGGASLQNGMGEGSPDT